MAIVATFDIPGMVQEQYDGLVQLLGDRVRQAPGFIQHLGFPVAGGWRVVELWAGRPQFDQWVKEGVEPNLPPSIQPQIHVSDLAYRSDR